MFYANSTKVNKKYARYAILSKIVDKCSKRFKHK